MKKDNKKSHMSHFLELEIKGGSPLTAEEMVNFYGTYEIQPTANTDNMYPTIAQGFNKKIIKSDCENKSAVEDKKNFYDALQ